MHFTKTLLALALASVSVLALPVDEIEANALIPRDSTYTCKPDKNDSGVKKFTVKESRALAQAKVALYEAGKSGDPHRYYNGDGIQWGVKGCNKKDAVIWECKPSDSC